MALFEGKEAKEEKQDKKARAIMAKYGLQNLPREYQSMVMEINTSLLGTTLMDAGASLTIGGLKAGEKITAGYLSALVKQNWIIIRQLDDIAAMLEKS